MSGGRGRRLERALRQLAEGDGRAVEPEPCPDGLGQLGGRRDGQDDRRAEYRRGEHLDDADRQRGGDLQGRLLAQRRARLARRLDRDALRLPDALDYSCLKGVNSDTMQWDL
jgi:hypothetical protein